MTTEAKKEPVLTTEEMVQLQEQLNSQPVPESAVIPGVSEMPAEPAKDDTAKDDPAEKAARIAEEHARMWAGLDGKSPFEWPDDARNLFQKGCACSLWGRSVVDMNPDQRILFVAYIDAVASDLYGQCKGLSMAMEMRDRAEAKAQECKVTPEVNHG